MRVLKPNAAAVAAKVIDGEAIIMNLTNGAYYSMTDVGGTIWEAIERSQPMDGIVQTVCSRYAVEASRARADAARLVDELLAEGLIVAEERGASAGADLRPVSTTSAYAPPVLNRYTEMADLLALDPPMPAIGEIPASEQHV